MTKQDTETMPNFRSEKLTPNELQALNDFVGKYPNQKLAAKALNLNNRNTLSNIMRLGSGSSISIYSIRKKINIPA